MALDPDKIIRESLASKVAPKNANDIEYERKRELLSKVQQRREDTYRMKGRVYPADPAKGVPLDKHFVWANKREDRVTTFVSEGYNVVRDGTARIKTDYAREDGTHIYGDLILMEIDKDLYEAIKLNDQILAVENAQGEALFEQFARDNRIPVSR